MNPAALELRDIHLPPPVSAWPPAPGWWLLAALVLALAFWLGRRLWRRHRARRAANAALRLLKDAERRHEQDPQPRVLASELSILLRRAALAYRRDEGVAGLTGENWLLFLDRQGGGQAFRDGPGRWLIEAPYRPATALDAPALLALCRQWLLRLRREAGRHV